MNTTTTTQLGILTLLMLTGSGCSMMDRMDQMNAEMTRTNQLLCQVTWQLDESNRRLASLEEQIASSNTHIGNMESHFAETSEHVAAIEQNFAQSNETVSRMEGRLKVSNDQLAIVADGADEMKKSLSDLLKMFSKFPGLGN